MTLQRELRDGSPWLPPAFLDERSAPVANPSAARNPFLHRGSLQNLGLSLLKRRQEEESCSVIYSVPRSSEYAVDWDASGCVFYPGTHLEQVDSLPFQLERLSLNDGAIFGHRVSDSPPRMLRQRGFPTAFPQNHPTTCGSLCDFHDQTEVRDMVEARYHAAALLRQQAYPCLRDLRGVLVKLSMDRHWSRRLQRKIEQGIDEDEIEILFSEIIDCVCLLMNDKFANCVLQKFVEICNPHQVTQILIKITRPQQQFIAICQNTHGIRVIQKLLKNITAPEQISLLMSALAPVVVKLVIDNNGHRVIEMCLETFPSMEIAVLYPEVINNCYAIATDKCGCRVLQQFINSADVRLRHILMKAISRHALALATDCYGNYVVQALLKMKLAEITQRIILQLRGNFEALSCNKYGSNVVEECMKGSSTEDFTVIILELIHNRHPLVPLDQYGNYVIQSAFRLAKEKRLLLIHNLLDAYVKVHAEQMKGHFYGKKLLTRLESKKLRLRK